MKKIFKLLQVIFIVSTIISCSNINTIDELEKTNETIVCFSENGSLSGRSVEPYYGYDKSKIINVELHGYLYNADTSDYELKINKTNTTLLEFLSEEINLESGKWNFTINAEQDGLPDVFDSVLVDIVANQRNLVSFQLKNYVEYNFKYDIYVPTSYNTTNAFLWMWNGKDTYSNTITTSSKISSGTYAGYTKYTVEWNVKPERYFIQMWFYESSHIIGYYYDSATIVENNLSEGYVIIDALESSANYVLITLKYPTNPELNNDSWSTTTSKAVANKSYLFPSECDIEGYAVEGWYLNSDYSDTAFTKRTIKSTDENVFYAKCVPIGLSNIQLASGYLLDQDFSVDTINYKVFCINENTDAYINISPTLLNSNKSYISSNSTRLNKIDGNSLGITVTSSVNPNISRTYTFTYSKNFTVAYYSTVIPTYSSGHYKVKPYYSSNEYEYKKLIEVIHNNNSITVDLDLSNVTGIENIPIGVENYTTTKVTNIKSMILPSSVKKIKSQAFYNWTGLTSITLPDSVEELESSIFTNDVNIKGDFYVSNNLKTIAAGSLAGPCFDTLTVANDNPNFVGENGLLLSKDKTKLVALVGQTEFDDANRIIPSSVKVLGTYCFAYTQLDYISIPLTVSEMEGFTFYYSKLKAITLPYTIKSTGQYAFGYCTSLEKADLSYSAISSLDNYIFMGDTALKEVLLPNGILGIGLYAFFQCSNLETLNIPATVSSLGTMAFYGTSKLTSLKVPELVKDIGDYVFMSSGITGELTLTNINSIGKYAFGGCSNLTDVTISGSIKEISDWAFYNCTSLKSVNLIGTLVKKIAERAFYNNTSLETISLPGTFNSVGEYAFYSCNKLKTVNYKGEKTSETVFNKTNSSGGYFTYTVSENGTYSVYVDDTGSGKDAYFYVYVNSEVKGEEDYSHTFTFDLLAGDIITIKHCLYSGRNNSLTETLNSTGIKPGIMKIIKGFGLELIFGSSVTINYI